MADKGRRCCCCLFNILWKFLITIIILVGLFILIVYLLIQPRGFKFNVDQAKLTQFNYTPANTNTGSLRYNLVLNFTARNPNKKLNIYYDKIEGHAFYEGTRFATTDVKTSFRQFTKSTNRTSAVFSGRRVVVFDSDQVSEYERDKREGVFHIDLKMYFWMRFRLGDAIGGTNKGNIKCKLEVPFGSNGTNAFEPTKCEVNF